jgi:hypothetical protein
MLDLSPSPRSDLVELSDAELAERLDAAIDAYEIVKKKYGFLFSLYLLLGTLRTIVKDPHEYVYPRHIQCEIRDIYDEMERRVAARKPPPNLPESG